MKRRGVAIVVHEVDVLGGMERQALRLAKGLAERGVRVTLVTTYTPRGLGLPLPSSIRERRDGFEIVRIPCFWWWSGEAVAALVDLVLARVLLSKKRRIDVVYTVQLRAAAHAGRVAAVRGLPTVVKFACGGTYGDMAQLERYPDLREPLHAIDRYACLSQQVRREVESQGFDPRRCVFVRNGVDLATFSPEGARAELGPGRWIVFIGRHDSQKRIDVLLRAFARIAPRLPDARLACAGKGPDEADLRELARELGVAERVRFLGERRDMPALLRAASVFVLPSAAEGLPNALLEALAVGVPSVVTDIPGTDEVVTRDREALMVPVDDEAALAAAIERILTDRELSERLVRAGRELVLREFDMERVVERHLELFESLPPGTSRRGRLLSIYGRFVAMLIFGWLYVLGRRLLSR
jgi:L-malate glycosyltransferase